LGEATLYPHVLPVLHSRLGARWSDVDVTKSLRAGVGRVQGTEVLLRDWGDTRLSPHPSMVALGCLDEGDERGDGQGCYSS